MASKKLRPGSFKSGTGGSKAPARRTGRTAGISQSAFAGYGFQGHQPAAKPPAQPVDEAVDEAAEEGSDSRKEGEAETSAEETPMCDADDSGDNAD